MPRATYSDLGRSIVRLPTFVARYKTCSSADGYTMAAMQSIAPPAAVVLDSESPSQPLAGLAHTGRPSLALEVERYVVLSPLPTLLHANTSFGLGETESLSCLLIIISHTVSIFLRRPHLHRLGACS